jgi:hypothetical protein
VKRRQHLLGPNSSTLKVCIVAPKKEKEKEKKKGRQKERKQMKGKTIMFSQLVDMVCC